MLQNTRGIVLRSVKYGDTSLITSIFTEKFGIRSYIVQGVRSARARGGKAGLLQPATLLDIVAYHKSQSNLNHLREFQPAYIYTSLQEEVVKNSIALFSVEVLLRLLPEHAEMPELFEVVYHYFCDLDKKSNDRVANFPLYFLIACSKLMGYAIHGSYTPQTPYINMQEGAFTHNPPAISSYLHEEETKMLGRLLLSGDIEELENIDMNAVIRNRILDWYIEFLNMHTQHMGTIKSLAVLRQVLH